VIVIPAVLIAAAVFAAATIERHAALKAGAQQKAGQRMLTAILDEETGARGYFETRQPRFLGPWLDGSRDFAAALARARADSAGDGSLALLVAEQGRRATAWHAAVAAQIQRLRRTGQPPSVAAAASANDRMDAFRQLNALFTTELGMERNRTLASATWWAVGVAAGVSIVILVVAILLMRRIARLENRRLRRQQELRELLQVAASEEESQELLIRHVERTVPGSGATILTLNNSEDRLEPRCGDAVGQTPLRDLETQLGPRSCMSVRLSRSYLQRPGDELLMRCEACGRIGAEVLCEPLLVGGQVIGSVLVASERTIRAAERANVHDAVVQAAPILANQRNLELAEARAASDALTGLPNRRAADETLKRMVAQAGRTVNALSVVLLDLDHFKQVNDLRGHEQGDKALAAVGQILSDALRASDFAARFGGEEFLLLLPDTDRAGAIEVAEKLRRSIERAEIPNVGTLTASFGISTLPGDAVDPEHLLRKADRALYAAKARGRNRVEVAVPRIGPSLRDEGDPPG
jgi:diguanylate cyclase (GGDEF)-like protein